MCLALVSKHKTVSTCIGVTLFLLSFLLFFGGNALLEYEIQKKMILSENSYVYKTWKDLPTVYYNVYMFNVTNPDEIIQNDSKPFVQEVGPYVISEHRHKENITFNDNGTVSYLQRRTYFFERDKTHVDFNSKIVLPNLVLIAANAYVKYGLPDHARETFYPLLNQICGQKSDNCPLFTSNTLPDILFDGWTDPLLILADMFPPFRKLKKISSDGNPRIALLADWNGTTFEGAFNVHTGAQDINRLGYVTTFINHPIV